VLKIPAKDVRPTPRLLRGPHTQHTDILPYTHRENSDEKDAHTLSVSVYVVFYVCRCWMGDAAAHTRVSGWATRALWHVSPHPYTVIAHTHTHPHTHMHPHRSFAICGVVGSRFVCLVRRTRTVCAACVRSRPPSQRSTYVHTQRGARTSKETCTCGHAHHHPPSVPMPTVTLSVSHIHTHTLRVRSYRQEED
jgi:hypothetical protein